MADREKLGVLKPADWTKEDLGTKFRGVLQKRSLLEALKSMVIAQEPHNKWAPGHEERELHYHIVMKMAAPFAHAKICTDLGALGCKGFFTFPRAGWASYLAYVLLPSAKKLQKDLDPCPMFWPPSLTKEKALEVIKQVDAKMLHRNSAEVQQQIKATQKTSAPKRRRTLTFSEFTDYVVENRCVDEADVWRLAKRLKTAGEDLMWNYLENKDVGSVLRKALRGWHHESLPQGMLQKTVQYPISAFIVPEGVRRWMDHGSGEKALILHGEGGLGKTELACAVMYELTGPFFFLDKLDAAKKIQFRGGEGLVIDDVNFSKLEVDDVKSWLDIQKPRFTHCRNDDAFIPAKTMRIFTTNSRRVDFFPVEARMEEHVKAIKRRVEWVDINEDVRRPVPLPPPLPLPENPDEEEDPFGFGFDLR